MIRSKRASLLVTLLIVCFLAVSLNTGQNVKAASNWTYLHTSGKNILDANNNIVHISGVNWFGAETPDYAPDGLWSINFKTMLNQIKSLGYNTIRLPYSTDFLDLKDTGGGYTPNLSLYANPDLADPADPSGQTPLKGVPLLDKIINYAGSIGLRVFLDRHRAEASNQSPLWYDPGSSKYTEARWISDWKWFAGHYLNNPTVIGADLHNEPHSVQGNPSLSACWGCGDTNRDWKLAAQRAGNAILSVNPNWLIIVEGTDTNPITGAGTWWGGDLSNAGNDPVVLSSPGHVVYSPHEYPASLFAQSWFSDPTYPNNMPSVWESHWGYLDTNNIAPVLIGEFGSRLSTTSDQQWFSALTIGTPGTGYIRSKSLNWTFWSWNPNSGDTGGILNDDWTTVIQAKQSVLAQIQYPFIGSPSSGPTSTATNTSQPTFQPPTNTPTKTNTPVGPTPTRTNTPVGPTPTRTNTPVPPTATRTNTPVLTVTGGTLKVQYFNADVNGPNDNQIKPHFSIVNTGNTAVGLSSLKLRYWFTGEAGASTYSTWCDYATINCSNITSTIVAVSPTRTGADHYLELTFSTGAGNIVANGSTGEIQSRFNKTDWSNFTETNDYSYGTATSFVDWRKVTLYQNGTLVWGTEP